MNNLEKLKPLSLLLLRCALGLIFIVHGMPKLFGDPQRVAQFFQNLGLPPFSSYVAGVVEVFGGGMLVAGLFTRLAGLLLAGQMGVAIWVAHLGKGVLAVREYEFPLVLAAAAFVLVTTGAGAVSVDRILFKDKG